MGFKLPSFNFFKGKPGQAAPTGPTTKLGLSTTLVMQGLQKMVGDSGSGLFMIDRELATRPAPSMSAGA